MTLTANDIINMEPGKALDWEIAKLMNVDEKLFNFAYEAGNYNYSTDISAAMEVEEKVQEQGIENSYVNRLCKVLYVETGEYPQFKLIHATPAQRSKAALLAVMEKEASQ